MKIDAKGLIILLVVVTVLVAVVLYWQNLQIGREIPPNNVTHQQKTSGLGSTIYDYASNPVANAPETNALKDSVMNPFDTYHNPFEIQ
jgi:hypothetical protein